MFVAVLERVSGRCVWSVCLVDEIICSLAIFNTGKPVFFLESEITRKFIISEYLLFTFHFISNKLRK